MLDHYHCHNCGWIGTLDEADYLVTAPATNYGHNDASPEEGEHLCPDCGDEIDEAGYCESCNDWFAPDQVHAHLCVRCTAYKAFEAGATYGEACGITQQAFPTLDPLDISGAVMGEKGHFELDQQEENYETA